MPALGTSCHARPMAPAASSSGDRAPSMAALSPQLVALGLRWMVEKGAGGKKKAVTGKQSTSPIGATRHVGLPQLKPMCGLG